MTELTLFEQLLEAARIERERVARGRNHVNRDELEVELNQMGYMRWYLHPALEEPSTRALYFFELEVPKGSRSGLMQHQGGVIHFVLEGSGWTEYEGGQHVMYLWVPARREEVTEETEKVLKGIRFAILAAESEQVFSRRV